MALVCSHFTSSHGYHVRIDHRKHKQALQMGRCPKHEVHTEFHENRLVSVHNESRDELTHTQLPNTVPIRNPKTQDLQKSRIPFWAIFISEISPNA
jgi:hypothetical protein